MEIYRETKMRPPEKSRAPARIVTLLAVPVVYLLSVPPLVLETLSAQTPSKEGQPGPKMQAPPWVQFYAVPYDWVASKSFLRKPLDCYADWCAERMEK
jgi:hypothetical protein